MGLVKRYFLIHTIGLNLSKGECEYEPSQVESLESALTGLISAARVKVGMPYLSKASAYIERKGSYFLSL